MPTDFIYLASTSPRRRELLQQIGVSFRCLAAGVDESALPGEAPQAYVRRLAAAKAEAGWRAAGSVGALENAGWRAAGSVVAPVLAAAKAEAGWKAADPVGVPVLAADTAVVVDGALLGKPSDREDALGMLARLSGRSHRVLTAVALRTAAGLEVALSDSEVWFRTIDAAEAISYWDSGEPKDKAGGYAIQGLAAVFVAQLHGSYSGVMGLPLFETAELLIAAGVPCWQGPHP